MRFFSRWAGCRDGIDHSVGGMGLGAGMGRDFVADINKLAILHGERYRFGLFRVHGIDEGIFYNQVRDLGIGQGSESERKRH